MAYNTLNEEGLAYIAEHKIEALMSELMHDLLVALPDDPLTFLAQRLEQPPVPNVLMLGAPLAGKTALARALAEATGAVYLHSKDIITAGAGVSMSDTSAANAIRARLQQPDIVAAGYVLDGFPTTRAQALSLQINGVLPSTIIAVDVAKGIAEERAAARAEEGTDAGQDDTPEGFGARWSTHKRFIGGVLECYPRAVVHLDGERDPELLLEEAQEIVETRCHRR